MAQNDTPHDDLDLSLAMQEGRRLLDVLNTTNPAEFLSIALRIRGRGQEIISTLSFITKEITRLEAIVEQYYAIFDTLTPQVDQAQKDYYITNENPDSSLIEINEKWAIFLKLSRQANNEFKRVEELPEVIELKKQINELYNQQEELLLEFGSIVAPVDFDDVDPLEA